MASWHDLGRGGAGWLRLDGKTANPAAARLRPYRSAIAAFALMFAGTARAEPAFFTARVAPILDRHCTVCHGTEKQKGGLRLDSFESLMKGGEDGAVAKPGDVKGSELVRRINLPRDDEEAMPSDGKPALSAYEIKTIEAWIAGGASATKTLNEFPDAPKPPAPKAPQIALAPDWHPRAAEIAALEKSLGIRLVPRSQTGTDGLVLRTASAPARCNDAAMEKLAPVAPLIVEAELARTKLTDAGLKSLAACENLREIDLTRTAITSDGLAALATLKKLEAINLTETAVDDRGVSQIKSLPALKRIWLFGTKATLPDEATKVAAH